MGPFPARKLFKRTLNLLCSSIGSRATCHSRTNSHSARLDRSAHGGRGSSRWVSGHIVLCGDPALLEHSEAAVEDCRDVLVVPEFVTAEEGETLLREINRTLRGKSYQYNHWDGVRLKYRNVYKPGSQAHLLENCSMHIPLLIWIKWATSENVHC